MSEARVRVFFYGSYMNRQVLSEVGLELGELDVGALSGFDTFVYDALPREID